MNLRFPVHAVLKQILMIGIICLMVFSSDPAQSTEPIRIGAIFSLTGIAASHNEPLIDMTRFAVEELNRNGGLLNRPVELLVFDNQSTAIGSVSAAKQAIEAKVAAVIGAHWSSHSLAMAPLLQEAGIPMISPGSTNPAVTRVGNFIFRVCFIDSFQGRAMARFAYTYLGARTAIVMKNMNEAYSVTLSDVFAKAFAEKGGRVLAVKEYRGKAVDFAGIIEPIQPLQADVIYVPGYTIDSGLLIKQAVTLGIYSTFLGGDAWDEIGKVAGSALEGSYQSAPWHPGVPFPESLHLKQVYRKYQNREISNYSAPLAYDAVMLLAEAIERCAGTDRKKIRDQLAETHDFRGATGRIQFDAVGDPRNKEIMILKYDKGTFHFIQSLRP